MSEQNSWRHHFVPRFYFRPWADPKVKQPWVYLINEAGGVEGKPRSSRSFAYGKHLYSWQEDGLRDRGTKPDQLETDFFGPLDDAASKVHRKLVAKTPLTEPDRLVWAIFLKSLLERSPKRTNEVRNLAKLPGSWEEAFASLMPGGEPDPGFSEFFSRVKLPAVIGNTLLDRVVACTCDPVFIEGLLQMEWSIVSLVDDELQFLTGDSPLIHDSDEDDPEISVLSIALSPKRLFVAHFKHDEIDPCDFATNHSASVVWHSEKYVVSCRALSDDEAGSYKMIADAAATHRS